MSLRVAIQRPLGAISLALCERTLGRRRAHMERTVMGRCMAHSMGSNDYVSGLKNNEYWVVKRNAWNLLKVLGLYKKALDMGLKFLGPSHQGEEYFFSPSVSHVFPQKEYFPQTPSLFPQTTFQSLGYVM